MARKAGITHEQVIDAAAGVADRDGLAAVTLAAVAGAIGVRAPSLYSHVDGLDGLRRDLARRATHLLGERLRSAAGDRADPVAALRSIGHAYRGFAHDHPGLYACLLPVPQPDDDPEGAAAAEVPVRTISALLADLGISIDRHVDVIRAFRALLHGFVDLELGHGFGLAQPVDASFDLALDLLLRPLADERSG